MNSRILAVAALLMVALLSCSSEDNGGDVAGAQHKPAAEDPQHVWKGQVEALEKARNVENDLNEAHQKRQEEFERQMQ